MGFLLLYNILPQLVCKEAVTGSCCQLNSLWWDDKQYLLC
jgi:hypothetical protein